MSAAFLIGVIVGAGLMAVVIFGAQAWYERRYPITRGHA